jgi:hypothetical protein
MLALLILMAAAAVIAAGCSAGTPDAIEKVVTQPAREAVGVEATPQAKVAATPAPTSAARDDAAPLPVAYRVNRMIIKNAELRLQVTDTDAAIDRVTQIAADTFGYILTARSWYQADFKYATITIGVPVDEFENAVRRLRALAVKVLDENASGTDVTDQFVDLESKLRNLEATEARIRSFLDKATSVEEALRVNQELAEITAQIEQIKGQMNYLRDRAAYSTITIHLEPEVPTPTPTPTPTVTPTPTPVAWRPGQTLSSATDVLGAILRTLADLFIWLVVVLGPFILLLALLVWIGIRLRRRWRKTSE